MSDVTMPLNKVQPIVEHLLNDGTRLGLILGNDLNTAMGASARRRAERAAVGRPEVDVLRSEDDQRWIVQIDAEVGTGQITVYVNDGDAVFDADPDTGQSAPELHPTLLRFTHVRCGWTTTDPSTLETLNGLDVGCIPCAGPDPTHWVPEAYGRAVWEHRDGTLWETESNEDGEVVRHQPVRTHVQIYKSWVNGPEWWVVPRPNTGDIDGSDNLIIGFDTYEQALTALPNLRTVFSELGPPDGIAWRDRNDPIYQLTTPKEN